MWNFRLVRCKEDIPLFPESVGIYEVYYEDGVTMSRTLEPVALIGDCSDEISDEIKKISLAFEKPILDDSIFEE